MLNCFSSRAATGIRTGVVAAILTLAGLPGGCSHNGGAAAGSALAPTVERTAGWNIVRLAGSPYQIGLGYARALGPEIDESIRLFKVKSEQRNGDDQLITYAWFRQMTEQVIEPKVPEEYRQEMRGIVAGLAEQGFKHDYLDVVAFNAQIDLEYYYPVWLKEQDRPVASAARTFHAPERCSAFIATGDMTVDGRIVAAHNIWDAYITGQRANVILDITPRDGHRFVMDTNAGLIHSGTDWFINDAGIILTETTISDFEGFDTRGIPEFIRARQAAQYSASIDDVYRILVKGNNGGYANTWLFGDIRTGEIAKLELGLKNVIFHRSTQGAYVGANFPEDPKLIAEEITDFTPGEETSETVRRARWAAVLEQYEGKIDAQAARNFMGDTTDARTGAVGASPFTLCGRRLVGRTGGGPSGATNAKVTTAAMAETLSFWAIMNAPDGASFEASSIFAADAVNAERIAWMKPFMRDMPGQKWIVVEGGASGAK